ncbi:MAG: peptidase domain-containing ABC transporter [Bacteroidota bacterium]
MTLFDDIHRRFQDALGIAMSEVNYSYLDTPDLLRSQTATDAFIRELTESGARCKLIYLSKTINKKDFESMIVSSSFPFLYFIKQGSGFKAIMIINGKRGNKIYVSEGRKMIESDSEQTKFLIEKALKNEDGSVNVMTCFPNEAVDDPDTFKAIDLSGSRYKIVEKLLRMLAPERKEILYVLTYAVFIGLISLTLPLGVQSLIGFISSGQVVTSSTVLIIFILLGVIFSGLMMIFQLELVEFLQQKLFTRTAFAFAFRIPRLRMEAILKYNPPELMNRFFDTLTLQKGVPVILIDLSAAILQVFLGIFLLSLYHPLFILLGALLVITLISVLRMTGPKGLRTALAESEHKYSVANWLEELARSISTFKLAGHSTLSMDRTDYHVGNYLHARENHFKILKVQYYTFIIFKTVITAILLIIGVSLVVNRQINLGQFVAAEIVIILIMNSIEKIIQKIDDVYDVLVSIEKITKVTSLPVDESQGTELPETGINALSIVINELSYSFPESEKKTIHEFNLKVNPSERVCLAGGNGSGKSTLVNILLGLYDSYQGSIRYNDVSLKELDRNSLMNRIGNYVSQDTLFDGTILENITIGRKGITFEHVVWAADKTGLSGYIAAQPQGYQTRLVGGASRLPESVFHKLILARNLVERPALLIIDDFLLGVEQEEKVRILEFLLSKENEWTILLISNDPLVMSRVERTVLMKNGKIIASGTYDTLSRGNEDFKRLINQLD